MFSCEWSNLLLLLTFSFPLLFAAKIISVYTFLPFWVSLIQLFNKSMRYLHLLNPKLQVWHGCRFMAAGLCFISNIISPNFNLIYLVLWPPLEMFGCTACVLHSQTYLWGSVVEKVMSVYWLIDTRCGWCMSYICCSSSQISCLKLKITTICLVEVLQSVQHSPPLCPGPVQEKDKVHTSNVWNWISYPRLFSQFAQEVRVVCNSRSCTHLVVHLQ